ncbi:MAG: SOS mutagenesis and repair protein UmuC [Flavobacterium psychrophilum]|nr:MAG: SOS mutagenesis and repair protein UmuC [Flavobacterium psychrophilum]
MYALVDCNNSYVSFERVFNPKLRNRPVIVLSNNDGCAIARSNEAKKLGVKMGDAYFLLKDLIKEHNIAVCSSNYALYADMSNRVMTLLKDFTPDVEVYSIDEAFMKFKGFENFSLDEIGTKIHYTLLKGLDVPVSIGFAPTKSLAKVANKIAKKFADKLGRSHYIIDDEEKRIKALKWTKIEDVWGIGRQHAKKLNSKGVFNAYQFTQLPDAWVRKEFTVVGLRLLHDLRGIPTIQDEDVKDKQNIACTRAFDNMISDYELMAERISTYTTTVAAKVRKQNSNCQVIHVFIQSNGFRQDLPQYNAGYSIKLPFPTSSTFQLNKYAQIALKLIYREGFQYKKAGVIIMAITPDNTQQLSMFEYEDPRHKVLMNVIDRVNTRMLGEKIKFGRNDLRRKWKMRQDFLSKKFTTNIHEIITAKAN